MYVDVPDSSSDLFSLLLDKVESCNLYRSAMSRIYLPIGLQKLCISNPVKPIEIVITPNESYSLKTFGITSFNKLPTQISHLHSLEHFSCRSTPVLELDFELFASMENLTTITMLETSTKNIIFSKQRRFPLLRSFIFWGNHLTTLNATSWNFPSLEELDLSFNEFTVLPKQIATFVNLTRLSMDNNLIKSIDLHIFAGLRRLVVLDLEVNQFSSVTGKLQLPRLSELRLDENCLEELDVSHWFLPALFRIGLGRNFLKSVIGFTECFGGASFIHLYQGQWDCDWLQEVGRSIKGMIISYIHQDSSYRYCFGNRLGMTERSFVEVYVNGTPQQYDL